MKRNFYIILLLLILPFEINADNYMNILKYGTPRQKAEAMYQLGYAGNKKAFWFYVKYLSYLPNNSDGVDAVKVREAAAEALGRIKDPRSVKYLIERYDKEKVFSVKKRIVFALSFYRDKRAYPVIENAASSEDEFLHFEGVLTAAKYAVDEFKDILLKEYNEKEAPAVLKTTAAFGLIQIEKNNDDYKQYLIDSLKNKEQSVRYWAAFYIRQLKMTEAEKFLIKALEIENVFWVENEMKLALQVIYYEKDRIKKKKNYNAYEFILN